MPSYALLFQNNHFYVKEWNFFLDQGGREEEWGKNWIGPIVAGSLQDAYNIGALMLKEVGDCQQRVDSSREEEYWAKLGNELENKRRREKIAAGGGTVSRITPEQLAVLFHDTYERLAPDYGYETREDTRDFDPNTPNGKLMIAVCEYLIEELLIMECNENGNIY